MGNKIFQGMAQGHKLYFCFATFSLCGNYKISNSDSKLSRTAQGLQLGGFKCNGDGLTIGTSSADHSV